MKDIFQTLEHSWSFKAAYLLFACLHCLGMKFGFPPQLFACQVGGACMSLSGIVLTAQSWASLSTVERKRPDLTTLLASAAQFTMHRVPLNIWSYIYYCGFFFFLRSLKVQSTTNKTGTGRYEPENTGFVRVLVAVDCTFMVLFFFCTLGLYSCVNHFFCLCICSHVCQICLPIEHDLCKAVISHRLALVFFLLLVSLGVLEKACGLQEACSLIHA